MENPIEDLTLWERFLLSPDRKAFLNTLIKHSEEHKFFRLLIEIKESQENPKSLLKDLKKLDDKYLLLAASLKMFDLAKSEEQKKEAIQELQSKFSSLITTSYKKPSKVQGSNLQKAAVEIPESIELSDFRPNHQFDAFYESQGSDELDIFTSVGVQMLDPAKVANMDLDVVKNYLNRVLDFSTIPDFPLFLEKLYKRSIEEDPSFKDCKNGRVKS